MVKHARAVIIVLVFAGCIAAGCAEQSGTSPAGASAPMPQATINAIPVQVVPERPSSPTKSAASVALLVYPPWSLSFSDRSLPGRGCEILVGNAIDRVLRQELETDFENVVAIDFATYKSWKTSNGSISADLVAVPRSDFSGQNPRLFLLQLLFLDSESRSLIARPVGTAPAAEIHASAGTDCERAIEEAQKEIAEAISHLIQTVRNTAALQRYPTRQQQELALKLQSDAIEAEKQGQAAEALGEYLKALGTLSAIPLPLDKPFKPGSSMLDQSKLGAIRLSSTLHPVAPEQYRREMIFGLNGVKDATGPDDYQRALSHFLAASHVAPWEPAPYKNMGFILKKQGNYAASAYWLSWYLIAAPNAPDAREIQDEIYVLQEKQESHAPLPQ